jgi:hypothetical protein
MHNFDRTWLRRKGSERLSKADLADLLDRIVDLVPEWEPVVERIAAEMVWAKPSPYPLQSTAPNPWLWPRQEWTDWSKSLERLLDSVPSQLRCSVLVTLSEDPRLRLLIAQTPDEHTLTLTDPDRDFAYAASRLGWEALESREPSEGSILCWTFQTDFALSITAADLAAQAFALIAGLDSPAELTVGGLDFS